MTGLDTLRSRVLTQRVVFRSVVVGNPELSILLRSRHVSVLLGRSRVSSNGMGLDEEPAKTAYLRSVGSPVDLILW